MGTNNNTVVVSFSIAILLMLSLLLLLTYNSKCNVYNLEPMENMPPSAMQQSKSVADISNAGINFDSVSGQGPISGVSSNGGSTYNSVSTAPSVPANPATPANSATSANPAVVAVAGQASQNVESFENAPYPDGLYTSASVQANAMSSQNVQACFPRDRLTAQDLLPKDAADSKWAQLNPSGSGDIHDQNYLTAGYHIGVNTVGQSMRNANLQLRSEIPNPQGPVGPWMISTIEPDLRQNTLEIGTSSAIYS